MAKNEVDFGIDPDMLWDEWLGQPQMYYEWAEKLADAKQAVGEAKAVLELTEAETALAIRKFPEKYGLEKVTEGGVEAVMITRKEYQAAKTDLIEAMHKEDIFGAAVSAMQHRKTALEKLVDLFLSNYHSAPKSSKNGREHVEDMERKRDMPRGIKSKRK